ncbi:MAG TPA: hypothetical protein VNS80_02470 [Pseudolysinimonas sp.]|nr:hypothetical protein [Pseudolysinimonas sp.]
MTITDRGRPVALHIASALELGDDLSGIVAYDDRLSDAARSHGIAVVAPR